MKVAIECNSPLLQRSLELFLSTKVSTYKQCDVVISDKNVRFEKPSIIIGSQESADLIKPFSKAQLLSAIENKVSSEKEIHSIKEIVNQVDDTGVPSKDFSLLEKRITQLTQEYQDNLLSTIKAFYEN